MESPRRKRKWIPRVERNFEASRLESQLMVSAYGQVLPPVQHRISPPGHWDEAEARNNIHPRQAAGA